ncbi:MAG TPA: Ig-like domain repeat protein [Methanobrevibacter smithii]|nr:Ig-like domain repeat protein [Methanobrevibacter smithii]HJI97978.1 Ig-like domain repeat protein [Methanobrevibacter smithii]
MSLKKNIGVLVLLLVLLSMSAVSAEDVSINADDTYQTPNEIQKDFTSLQTDIDNSQNVFELTYDVKHGDDEIDNYGISITKNTIINGNGHTIDANGHGSIFVVKDSSVTLTLNDLTLINANPVSDSSGIVSNGGAVYFDGSTLIVNNVNFKNNTVYKYGGAIYTTGTCIVDSSVFDGNDVQFRSQNSDNGGAAIYADNGASLLISNSQIINNHKNMVIRDNNVGDLVDGVVVATGYTKISKSYFRNNSGCYGGAVTSLGYTNAGKNQIIIENSVFDSNRAFQGAAVNVIGSTFKISGTNFTNNKGVGYGSGNPNVGALLTWYGCEGTISDCNFINNTADNGAAYRLGDDNNGVSSASVDSCTFINNTASNQGGAVYEGGKTGKATLDIKNSTFTNNSAKKEGSAIYSRYTLNIDDDTTFTNNMVYMYYTGTLNIGEIKTFTDLQKAVNMVEGDIYLSSNVTMLASEADNFVNGIVVDHLVNLKCDGFTINANNLGRIFNVTSTADKLNIYNANLINGNADIGGAIYNTGSVYAYNTNFINNTAATMGGAVFNNGNLTIQKCIVDNNDITKRTSSDSEDYGGAAIYNWYDSTLFIKNSTISNNLKNYKNGDYVVGAVTSLGKTIISQNSYFVNNSGRWGGAITTSGSSLPGKKVNELTISDSTFSKNGGLYGAGIFIQGSKFSITSCVFDSNTASGKGNMTPNDNNGAAIEVTNTDKAITGTISKTKFTNNKAQYGGAIDICAGTIKIINSKFINNSADVEGGAIDINAANGNPKVTISSSNFINNSAPVGGAICNVHDLTVKGSTFIDNTPNTIFNWVGAGGNLNLNIRTFTDLQNAIGLVTGTLTLNQNIAMTAKEAANFTNGITINKDITIDGKGHTIDAKNLGRIFSIGEGFTVTLTNATLINGKATEGGAIYNDGSLTLSDVKLSDNAADSYGGAVFNNGELVVSDSVFDSNDIVNRGSASVDYGGAAIYNWKEGTLKVTNSNFTNNIKNYKNGDNLVGAITTIGNATVSGSNFVNNSGRWGGAISATGAELRKNSSTLTVSNTIFKDNSALYAGAVYIWGSNYNIADCVFDNNTAFGKGNMTPNNNNGGALVVSQVSRFNEPITGTISGSNFTNNKAQYGGAAYFNKGFVTITDSVFENNIATAEGGAVGFSHASVKDLVVSINNSSFVGNKAPVAGAIFTNVDSKITNSNFINNSAAKIGGAICNVNDLTVENSKFVNNTPQAIHNFKELHLGIETFTDLQNAIDLVDGILTLDSDIAMTDDEAAGFVGGVAINKDIVIDGKGHTIDAKNLGRIFSIGEGFAVTLTNATLINGKAVEGGAIYNDGSLTLSDVKLSDNAADGYGGAVFNNGELVVSDSVFDSNDIVNRGSASVDYGGAAIYNWYDGILTVSGSNFTNNIKNYKNGDRLVGAVATIGDATISDSYFVNNSGRWGGAISASGYLIAGDDVNTLTVSGSTFKENGGLYGAGIFVAGSDFTVSDCVFDKNTAFGKGNMTPNNNNGAAIVVTDTGKDITGAITGSNFTNNKAQYGGAIYICEGNIAISDSLFENNSGRWGGALSVMGGESSSATNFIDIDGTKFVNNSALYGGAMFVWGSNYSISNSVFDNNSAFGKGNMTPNNNNGGALVVTQGNIPISGTIINSNFTNNKAQYGGAAWINEGTVDISNSNFINNTATVKAGAIGFEPAYTKITATVYGTNFINNTAGVDGGAIYSNGDLRISDSDFDNNKAQKADIIYSNINGLLSINGNNYSNYTENKAPIINLAGIETISSDGGVIITVLDNKTVNVCYGDVVTLHAIITVDGVLVANQDLSFSVYNGENVVVCKANSLLNGSYVATYKINDVINKTVSIVYDGPEVHINTGILNVSKANPDLTVGALNITVGDLEIITVTGPKDATGLITLTLNGIDYILPIYNGEAKFYFQDLAYGTYDVSASYSGDNHYVAAENSTVFKVDKVLANLNIHVEDITFGENGLVIITLPSDIDGSIVTVNVNGKVYPVDIENGFGKLPLRELDACDYTISAVFAGNDKYLPGVSNALLTVSKADPALNVLISDVGYDGVFNINVALTGVDAIGLNGNVIVTVNNKNYSVNIVNGKGTAVGVKLAAGTYDFTAAWAGNDNYNAVGDSGKFSVAKVDSIIDVAVSDIKVGEDAVISVKLLSDATGSVTVTVNGKDYTETVVNGVANVKVADLKAGTYDVAVKYSGDNNYNAAVATSSFTVSKVDSTMDVTVNDIVFGGDLTVDVVLPGDATGEVVITVNGVDYHVAIENGKATGTIGGLVAGDYTVTVKYAGDDKYTAVEIAKGVNVAKAQPVLGVVIADVDYGNGFVIEATLTGVNGAPLSGNVIVTVAGKEYTVKVTDGKGIATGDKLAAGTYAFAAVWAGDDNYNIVTENGDFKVNKIDSSVVVNVNNIKVGEDAVISVKLASDATGDVTVSVDGKEYKVAIENGKAVKTISGLKADDYTVTVKYAGDNNYNEANADAEFSVSKISDYNMDISVPEIKEGVNSTIGVDLPKDATGTVTVEIDGKKYTANVIDGTANVIVSGLSAGDYNITTVYSGDAKYDSMTKKGNVTVIPNINVNLDVSDVEMFYHDGTRLIAKLTDFQGKPIVNATIYFSINGVTYAKTTDANGTASMGLNLDSNVYPVTVTYNGSAFYSKISKNITVTINSSIIADDLVKMYQNATRFYAKFMGSDGKVLANTQVKFNIHGVFYTKTTNNDGVADLGIMLRPGTYILTAYNPVTGEQQGFNITVKSLIVQNDLTKYYMNASKFQATIYDKNGSLAVNKNVTFNIHGVFYTRTTDENGVVSLGISLRPGEYVITTMYEGLDLGNTVTVLPTLVTHDLNMKYMDGSNFTAQTLDGQGNPLANQNVSFNVNGVFYHKVTDDNGFASLTIRLMSGKYIITSSWNDFQTGNNITIS